MNLMKKEISNSLVSKAARDEFNHYKRLLRLSDQLSMSGGGGGVCQTAVQQFLFMASFERYNGSVKNIL